WNCKSCKKQFSAKTGTIFEESPLPLSKWLPAVWLITNAKNGISSCEVARAMAVTQKTAWFMLHRIREAMANGSFEKFSGTVEPESAIFTDESPAYNGLTENYYRGTVNHSAGEYARGEVHTNGLENWFCLFKRCFKGTWTHLSEEHLQRYLNEQEFRFDNRKDN